MKKRIGIYCLIWAICLAVFNVIVFVTPNEMAGYEKFGGAFWAGYVFITVAFIGQLVCSLIALSENNRQKLFYKIPLIRISYVGLVLTVIAGTVCMVIPDLPNWVGIIICMVILALDAITVIKAAAAASVVGGIDEKIKEQTFFIKSLTVDAESLMSSAKSDELRAEAKKVYEAIRYSDPMSDPRLADAEAEIRSQFSAFEDAVIADDAELAKANAQSLLSAVEKRNGKCKLFK